MVTPSVSTRSVSEALDLCRRQQGPWAAIPVVQRLAHVRRLRHLLVEQVDNLCAAMARDLGKTVEEGIGGDVLPLTDACRYLERQAAALLRPQRVSTRHRPLWLWGQRDVIHRRPRGIVGIIGTWNYPVFLNGVQLVQALTAGNGILWKPSEVAPSSATVLFDLLNKAGFPAGLVQLLETTREAGQQLAEVGVDHIAFTGSAATGRMLARTLGERLISSTLELSGCDALFVLPDADVSLAARAAWFGATVNRGQTCLGTRRAFVHHSLQIAFIDALKALVVAAPLLSLAMPRQASHARGLLQDAVAQGAHLLEPASPVEENGDPALFRPTVVLDASPEMRICREDSFAPIMAVLTFETLEDALAKDACCPYGLGAAIFTRDSSQADELASRLRVGAVAVNDVIAPIAHPATPFGGMRQSGWGVTQGPEGLLEMTVPQVVSHKAGTFRPHYDLAAGCKGNQEELARGLLQATHATTLGQRCSGVLRLVKSLWRKGGES